MFQARKMNISKFSKMRNVLSTQSYLMFFSFTSNRLPVVLLFHQP